MRYAQVANAGLVAPSRTCKPSISIAGMYGSGKAELRTTTAPEPVLLALELTRQCNLQCHHCYVSAGPTINDGHYVTNDQWIHCLREAKANGIERVQFIGGEATLHSFLSALIDQAGKLRFADIELFSNATRLSDSLLDTLQRNAVRMATSLYGANSELHDQFTNVSGSFARTRRNIERALAVGIAVRVAIVRNENENLIVDQTFTLAQKIGVKKISVDVVRAFGRGMQSGSDVSNCEACGVSVLRVCSDGLISGCSMSREPALGHVSFGLKPALGRLGARQTIEFPATIL